MKKTAKKPLVIGRIRDGAKASTFGSCGNTRIIK
jgi:hypothetical protein